jgi:UDP-N-acetylglucosamine 2-epimerase (non-hydrolysing)
MKLSSATTPSNGAVAQPYSERAGTPPHCIAYIVGARPNFVKMAPVIARLRGRFPDVRHIVVHTGQHYDWLMSRVFVDDLQMPEPDYSLDVGSGTHAVQTARAMERLEPVLAAERPDLVIVPGDVNSTLAAALVAAKLNLALAHVEAGLRSFDRTMPEEVNRIVADEFSALLFAHSQDAVDNLLHEGIAASRIHFVGNTMIDTLLATSSRYRSLHVRARFGLAARNYLLVTLHRPTLVDGDRLERVLVELEEVAEELPVIFPVHPRTAQRIAAGRHSRLILTEPLSYLEFLSLQADAAAVLTDSGGVQEETTYLGVPCFTLRDTTERPVTISSGTNVLLGADPSAIGTILPRLGTKRLRRLPPPLWDGRAAERIADVVAGMSLAGEPPSLLPASGAAASLRS